MQAIVLVGGEGTRLRPLTLTHPKPAIRLVDRPFIRFMVDWLARHGVDEVLMACGFRAELLREALGEGDEGGPRISYMEEPEPLGTAGPIRLADDRGLLAERFLALNGDVLNDLDLTALLEAHERSGASATLGLHPVSDPTAYGLVRRDGGPAAPGEAPSAPGGEVWEFLEKPDPAEIDTDEVNAGAYVLERRVCELIPPARSVSIEREVFPRMVGDGLYGQRLEGYWMDIGTPARYLQASWDILEGRLDTEPGRHVDESGLLLAAGAEIDARAEVSPPAAIERRCEIAADARVGPRAVIGSGTSLAQGASVVDSVLDSGCSIGEDAGVTGSILARGVVVGTGATVPAGSVIGEGARIASGAQLTADARVPPGEEVKG
jgi:mannose-1-phosphate guanylyltransferase